MRVSAESPDKPRKRHGSQYRFLLTAAARSLSIRDIMRMSEDEARAGFRELRFADNDGDPYCVHCGCTAVVEYRCRPIFKCKGCGKQFSLTSGTLFHSRKLYFQDILLAVLLFVNGVNGESALHLSRNLGCHYKTAFVLFHKLRKAMADMQSENVLSGEVEIDGVFVGGYVRPENMIAERSNRRQEGSAKRRVIVTVRERRRGGRSRAFVLGHESEAYSHVIKFVQPSAHIITDATDAWGTKFLLAFKSHEMVNHSLGLMIDGVHTNGVESQNSRIRRAARGVYLQINGAHAQNYADELSWRDDHRLTDNGRQFRTVLKRAAKLPAATEWVGYWRKRSVG